NRALDCDAFVARQLLKGVCIRRNLDTLSAGFINFSNSSLTRSDNLDRNLCAASDRDGLSNGIGDFLIFIAKLHDARAAEPGGLPGQSDGLVRRAERSRILAEIRTQTERALGHRVGDEFAH